MSKVTNLGSSIKFSFPEVHDEATINVILNRTFRIPNDGKKYGLPPGMGNFPVFTVDEAKGKNSQWDEFGGVAIPMWDNEAMWISWQSGYPFAIKVAAGKINAVTGEPWKNELDFDNQDFMDTSVQRWIDGFCVEKGSIRQFVAAQLGEGKTVEEQLTGKAEFGGLQIIVYPLKAEVYEKIQRKRELSRGMMYSYGGLESMSIQASSYSATKSATRSLNMGMGMGGEMVQEIHKAKFTKDDFDLNSSARCFIHMTHGSEWKNLTGKNPTTQPFTFDEYKRYGLPYWGTIFEKDVIGIRNDIYSEWENTIKRRIQEGRIQISRDEIERITSPFKPGNYLFPKGPFNGSDWHNHLNKWKNEMENAMVGYINGLPAYTKGDGVQGSKKLAGLKTVDEDPGIKSKF